MDVSVQGQPQRTMRMAQQPLGRGWGDGAWLWPRRTHGTRVTQRPLTTPHSGILRSRAGRQRTDNSIGRPMPWGAA